MAFMSLIAKVCIFFVPYSIWRPLSWLLSVLFLRGRLGVRTFEGDFCDQLKRSEKSLIRWGDGESACLLGRNIYFQKTSARLRKYLLSIILEYNDEAPYVLGMPLQFFNASRHELISIRKLQVWENTRFVFCLFCPKDATYVDSLAFRPDKVTRWSSGYLNPYSLWNSVENIVLLHPSVDIYRKFCQNNLDKKVFWIPVPERDAFESLEKLLFSIEKLARIQRLTRQNCRILLAVGPTAKVLAYLLSKRFICYDLGHFFDTYKRSEQ